MWLLGAACTRQKILNLYLVTLGVAGGQTAFDLKFEEDSYSSFEGQEFEAPIHLTPIPDNGLFSFSLRVAVETNQGIAGFVSVEPADGLNFDGPLNTDAAIDNGDGESVAQGTADFFSTDGSAIHLEERIADVRIAGLQEGNYTLRLAPFYTLGLNEDVFIDGMNESLDARITFGSANLSVSRTFGTLGEVGAATLNRQTGLFEQTVTLTNTSGAEQDGFRVWVDGMNDNTTFQNAHGDEAGRFYLDYTGILAAGSAVNLVLEFFVSDRSGVSGLSYEVSPPDGEFTPPPVTNTIAVQPRLTFQGTGTVLLEFSSVFGSSYFLEYSDNMTDWLPALPIIPGTGQSVQWLDNGPPRTVIHPSQVSSRFYRVSEVNQ